MENWMNSNINWNNLRNGLFTVTIVYERVQLVTSHKHEEESYISMAFVAFFPPKHPNTPAIPV